MIAPYYQSLFVLNVMQTALKTEMAQTKSKPISTDIKKMLVWDSDDIPAIGDGFTVLWRSFSDGKDSRIVSIPVLVEEQADELRSRYLAWIYDVSQASLRGKRVVDILKLRSDFSFWWMSSLAQKFNASGASQIDTAIKLFVLENLINKSEVKFLELASDNKLLAVVLKNLCQQSGIEFHFKATNPHHQSRTSFPRRVYRGLPFPLQALIYLVRDIALGIPFLGKAQSPEFKGDVCLIDVLVHLDKKAYADGVFISNYWTSLTDKFRELKIKTNWIHNYFRQENLPSPVSAHALLQRFNQTAATTESHGLLEAGLDMNVIGKALGDYLQVAWSSLKLKGFTHLFQPAGSALNLWPLFKHEWNDSLRGQGAMLQCLRIALYEKVVQTLPHQRLGIYIQENQPWEMALIHAWRAAGHGLLVGVPHNTLRYWDLRYFQDPRCYGPNRYDNFPTPDLVAMHGPAAKNKYLEGAYPATELIEVEALRYQHLLVTASNSFKLQSVVTGQQLTVLICGDFVPAVNHKMLTWLSIAVPAMPPETLYILKPHPACPIRAIDYPLLQLQVMNDNLTILLPNCDVVFANNISSTTVDAYCAGIPVVRMLDGVSLNMSPLRGCSAGTTVTSADQLAETLLKITRCAPARPEPYFFLNESLPRWQVLLERIGPDSSLQ